MSDMRAELFAVARKARAECCVWTTDPIEAVALAVEAHVQRRVVALLDNRIADRMKCFDYDEINLLEEVKAEIEAIATPAAAGEGASDG